MTSPDVPGELLQTISIPARGHGSFTMHAGNVLRIVDVDGQQVADLVAFNLHDFSEKVNGETTMLLGETYNPSTGKVVYSDDCSPMFTIIEDTVGVNYPGALMCSEEMNRIRYGIPGTLNCRDNLTAAVRPFGLSKKDLPGAFTPFMKVIHHPDGRAELAAPTSKSGDYIDLRAEMDVLVAISACPQERNPVNGWAPSRLECLVYHRS